MASIIIRTFQIDFDSTSEWFKFKGESIVHGDATLKCGKRIILLTSKESLKILVRAKDICIDGTFKITPKPWKQVAIISAQVREGVWVPCAFGYLPDKRIDTYRTFLSLLKNSILNYDLELSATSLMADFEINWRKAILEAFPLIALIGKQFKDKLRLRKKYSVTVYQFNAAPLI